jgi:mono/diheme cytochrome c family protein
MYRIAAIIVAVGIAGAATPAFAGQADTAKGQKVYTDQKCALCHSIGGKGNAKGPLDDVGTKLTPDEMRQWITNAPEMSAKAKATRKPPMKKYTLPAGDVDALVAYLQTLKKK